MLVAMIPVFAFAGGVQDAPDTQVQAETPAAVRVVSLAPNITEVIYALGCGDMLVGRTDYCNYPPETAEVDSVGSITEPSVETVIELQPDIVIASTHAPKDAAEKIEAAGIPVKMYYGPESFEGVYDVINAVAAELSAEAEAEVLIADLSTRYDKLKADAEAIEERPSVYYVIGFGEGGDWTAGGDTFIGRMIEMAGGDNIAADVEGWSYSLEMIVEKQPEIILVGEGLKDVFINTPIYSDLDAVKNGRVYGVNEDTINRQGPRLIEGIEQLYAAISE